MDPLPAAIEAEVFADASMNVKVSAWQLDAKQTANNISATLTNNINNSKLYDLQGRCITVIPHKGLYILNGKKYVSH